MTKESFWRVHCIDLTSFDTNDNVVERMQETFNGNPIGSPLWIKVTEKKKGNEFFINMNNVIGIERITSNETD